MTPNEIQMKTFEKKMGGYRVEEVNLYLADVAAYLQSVLDEKKELEQKMLVLAEKIEEYRADEESLRAALVNAQKLGDSVIRDAKRKAESMMEEATRKADAIVHDARSNIDREALALTRMQGQVAEFKTQILNMYKRQMEMINNLPDELNLPSDVRKIMDKVASQSVSEEERLQKVKADKRNGFVLHYEQAEDAAETDEQPAAEDAAAQQPPKIQTVEGGQSYKQKKPHNDYGKLRFGEEYNLKRND